MSDEIDPRDAWDAVLHEIALARADRASTPRERRLARAIRANIERLIAADRRRARRPRDRSGP